MRRWRASLPADDGTDFENASRASWARSQRRHSRRLEHGALRIPRRRAARHGHPSLWRQARLNLQHGLFEVTAGVYQVRGFDISNITFIEGERVTWSSTP